MFRALIALAVLGLFTSMSMAQLVVGDDEKTTPVKHNPSYDNLYRPGNAIWRLRMLRMGMVPAINDTYGDINSTIDNISVESSAMVAEPIRLYNTKDVVSVPSETFHQMDEMGRPAKRASAEDMLLGAAPKVNEKIVIHQINPKGPDIQPAAKGEIIVKPYGVKAKASPIALKAAE